MTTQEQCQIGAHVLYVQCKPGTPEELYRLVLGLLGDVTPVVQSVLPAAALCDVAGSVRYFGRSPYELAQRIRLRALALYSVDTHIGVAPTRALATMAAARPGPDSIAIVPDSPEAIATFLHPLPVEALDGLRPAQAAQLDKYGIHSIGALAALPMATAQRILGGQTGRVAHERARGIDLRPVVPSELPHTVAETRRLDYDELDPERIRTELLDAVVNVAARLRQRRQVCRQLTLRVTFAGSAQLTRSRGLREASAHEEDLRTLAYRLFDSLGMQRARIRGIAVVAEQLAPAESAAQQITLDSVREQRLKAEPAIDRANRRFGAGTVRPGRLAHRHAG